MAQAHHSIAQFNFKQIAMVYISDLQQLISSWQKRLDSSVQPPSYKDALLDCIYELNSLIDCTLLDEMTEEDASEYLLSQQADDYFSNLEPEEFYATAI